MRHRARFAIAIAIAMLGASGGCGHSSDRAGGDSRGDPGAARADEQEPPIVVFAPEGKPNAAVLVEVVRTREAIRRGLMYRRELGENHGMLFLMGDETIHSFWMRNTYIPLDMIFVGKDKTVAGVVANAAPLTDDSRRIDKPSYYVVEVNAGWAAAHHVAAGTRVRFENVVD